MKLRIVKPSTEAEKSTRTTLDTIEVTPALVKSWKLPPFQRPLRINEKVKILAEHIRQNDGVIPGVIVLGILSGDRYIIDGQHRRESFVLSECLVGYVDVRICHFDSMAAMGEEFVNVNSRIVNMRPDDYLRGLEGVYAPLAKLRKRCPFIGYDNIRRGDKSPVLSMSAVLRCWNMSAAETPHGGGQSAMALAQTLAADDADTCAGFLELAMSAWGRDQQYQRLWINLNLLLNMWLYRRLVIHPYSTKTIKLTRDLFHKCLMSVSADAGYIDWLVGRHMGPHTSPAYSRLKEIYSRRLFAETGRKHLLPQPAWTSSKGGSR